MCYLHYQYHCWNGFHHHHCPPHPATQVDDGASVWFLGFFVSSEGESDHRLLSGRYEDA